MELIFYALWNYRYHMNVYGGIQLLTRSCPEAIIHKSNRNYCILIVNVGVLNYYIDDVFLD